MHKILEKMNYLLGKNKRAELIAKNKKKRGKFPTVD